MSLAMASASGGSGAGGIGIRGTLLVVVPLTLSALLLAEPIRWIITRSHRRHLLHSHYWEDVPLDTPDVVQSASSAMRGRAAKKQRVARTSSIDVVEDDASCCDSAVDLSASTSMTHSPPASPLPAEMELVALSSQRSSSSSMASAAAISITDSVSSSPFSRFRQKLYKSLHILGRFVNPWIEYEDRIAANIIEYITWHCISTSRNGIPKDQKILDELLPVVEPDFNLLNSFHLTSAPSSQMSVTWFGQSTMLVQMCGYNILTDPIFTSRTVGDMLGPRRIQRTPCVLADLPKIDICLVSHNHWDHLGKDTVLQLRDSVTWFVPRGLKRWFASLGVSNVVELDWWQEWTHVDESGGRPDLRVIGTPTQHWSGRHLLDVNSTLWGSFLVKSSGVNCESFFHCGDTGYCSVFKEIGRRYGPVTLAALPIGSYEPREFMKHEHVSPEEAVQIHMDLACKHSVGNHWGTFMMSHEYFLDPPRLFEATAKEVGLDEDSCIAPVLGEVVVVNNEGGLRRGRGARLWV